MTKSIMNSKRREVKEMRHAFAQSVIAMRRECGLPLEAIYNLELGNFERWGDILRIAQYYSKKVKVVFY